MYLVRKTAPSVTAVDLTTVKEHLRISHTAEDTRLTALIDVVTSALDGPGGHLRRAITTQTWYLHLRDFPAGGIIPLPLPPLQSVTAITYTDNDVATQTVDNTTYYVVTPDGAAGFIELADGEVWPSDVLDKPGAVRIEFVCGYGAAADVPPAIKQAMLLTIGELYADRGDMDPAPVMLAPGIEIVTAGSAAVRALLSRFMWRELA